MNQPQVSQTTTTSAIVPGDRLKERDPSKYSIDDLRKAVSKRIRNNIDFDLMESFMGYPSIQAAVDAYTEDHVRYYRHDRDVILTAEELQERMRTGNASAVVNSFLSVFKGEDKRKQVATEAQTQNAVRMQVSLRKITMSSGVLSTSIGRYLYERRIIFQDLRNNDNNLYLDRTKVTNKVVGELIEKLLNTGL